MSSCTLPVHNNGLSSRHHNYNSSSPMANQSGRVHDNYGSASSLSRMTNGLRPSAMPKGHDNYSSSSSSISSKSSTNNNNNHTKISSVLERLSEITGSSNNLSNTGDNGTPILVTPRSNTRLPNVRRTRVRPQSMYELTDSSRAPKGKTVSFSDAMPGTSGDGMVMMSHDVISENGFEVNNSVPAPPVRVRNSRIKVEIPEVSDIVPVLPKRLVPRPRLQLNQNALTGEWSVVRPSGHNDADEGINGHWGSNVINDTTGCRRVHQESDAYECYATEMARHVQQCRQDLRVALDRALHTYTMLEDDQQLASSDRQQLKSTMLNSFDEVHNRLENVSGDTNQSEYNNNNNVHSSALSSVSNRMSGNNSNANMSAMGSQPPPVPPQHAEKILEQFSDLFVEMVQNKLQKK